MPLTSAPSARRGRRLLAAVLSAVSMAAAAATLMTSPGHAAAQTEPVKPHVTASPSGLPGLTPSPTASPSPSCDNFFNDQNPCPTPTPVPSASVIVVSPVPDTPSPSPTTPSYLVGSDPLPSPRTGESVSSPVPLGGGFVDQLPTPSSGSAVAPPGTLAPHQGGLPLPFIAVGALLILGAVGSLIYAISPREKKAFATTTPAAASPVRFTPYGPDSPGTTILTGNQGQKPRPGPPA